MPNAREFKKNLIAFFFGCVAAIALAEAVVRTFPVFFWRYLNPAPCALKDIEDKVVGYRYLQAKNKICEDCYKVYPVTTNSMGFRGEEWKQQDNPEIAVLGDSGMFGQEVLDGDTAPYILGELLQKKVINASIRGIGTVTESEVYKNFVRPLHPKIVLLFFTLSNDVSDNSCKLQRQITNCHVRPCATLTDGKITVDKNFQYDPPPKKELSAAREKIKKYCLSCLVLNRFIFQKSFIFFHRGELRRTRAELWHIYDKNPPAVWEEAWQITEYTLCDLSNQVKQDGSRFAVIIIRDIWEDRKALENNYKKTTGFNPPENFDPLFAEERLIEICRRNDIPFFAMTPRLLEYRKRHNLSFPMFSYWCDMHFNPMGHFVIANIAARYLLEEKWVSGFTGSLENIERNLSLAPSEILGKDSYSKIYGHKVFFGTSKISKIINAPEKTEIAKE